MNDLQSQHFLDAFLDAWRRHNSSLLGLLSAIPNDAMRVRVLPDSPSVVEMFTHMHHERMISVQENAPEFAGAVPAREWDSDPDTKRIATLLIESADCVQHAVVGRINAEHALDQDFAHPLQLIMFLIHHEGYHHGQIKLALKASGHPITDSVIGPLVWQPWRAR